MEIHDDKYRVWYEQEEDSVRFQGVLRLNGMSEYVPILVLLNAALSRGAPTLRVDLRELEFINSSGILMLSKFLIGARDSASRLVMMGSASTAWHERSLANLQRLMPSLVLEIL